MGAARSTVGFRAAQLRRRLRHVHALMRADVPSLRAAVWAFRSARRAAMGVREAQAGAPSIPPPPPVGPRGEQAVRTVLELPRYSCLQRAVVRQAWDAAQGMPRELVIGVIPRGAAVGAHAWLEGDPPEEYEGFVELARWPSP